MKDHPILFTGEMVRAILDGRKTQTRRVIKPQPEYRDGYRYWWKGDWDTRGGPCAGVCTHGSPGNGEATWTLEEMKDYSPYGVPGDLLWVKETWKSNGSYPDNGVTYIEYRAGGRWERPNNEWAKYLKADKKWRPSIFMPKWACRLWLKVKSVRVERVQEIRQADVLSEGVESYQIDKFRPHFHRDDCPGLAFREVWDSINAKRGFGWDMNPFVWVVEFERSNDNGMEQ